MQFKSIVKVTASDGVGYEQQQLERPTSWRKVSGLRGWLVAFILLSFAIIFLDLTVHKHSVDQMIGRLVPTAMSSMALIVVSIETMLLVTLYGFDNTSDHHASLNMFYKVAVLIGIYFIFLGASLMHVSLLYFEVVSTVGLIAADLVPDFEVGNFEVTREPAQTWIYTNSDPASWVVGSGLLLRCMPTFFWLVLCVVSWLVFARTLGSRQSVKKLTLGSNKPEIVEEAETHHLLKYGRWLCICLAVNVLASLMTIFTYVLTQLLNIGLVLEAHWTVFVGMIIIFEGACMIVFYLTGITSSAKRDVSVAVTSHPALVF